MKITKKQFLFWFAFLYFIVCIITRIDENHATKLKIDKAFSTSAPVNISGHISPERNHTKLCLRIENTAPYSISAVQFIIESYDVYGNQIHNWQKRYIYQTKCIESNKQRSSFCIIPYDTKLVKLYIYSVYYKNNCYAEWGNRDLTNEEIITYAPTVYLEYSE